MSSILEMVNRHGIEIKKVSSTKGGEYHGPCPGCGGDDRFHVWPEQNQGEGSYWCRGCGKSGDAIQFLMDFEGLNFKEACVKLDKDIPTSEDFLSRPLSRSRRWEAIEHEAPAEIWRKKAYNFNVWAFESLFEHPDKFSWLAARGISEESVTHYGLGWNPGENGQDLFRDREGWGLSPMLNERGGRRPLWLPVGLVIPCYMEDMLQRIRIRRPTPIKVGPRYYVVPGSSMTTMVLKPGAKVFIVVEAELDAILIAQETDDRIGAVALGSATAKPDKKAFELMKESVQVLVALDFDKAGKQAWPWWKEHLPDSEPWPVPAGKDPGDAYRAGVDIRKWVSGGLPPAMTI